MKDCLFCAIARGEIPAHRVCETDELVAFLDIHPVRPGHTLIIPRDHHAYFDDLPPTLMVGAIAYTNSVEPDLTVGFEEIVFADVEGPADCTAD